MYEEHFPPAFVSFHNSLRSVYCLVGCNILMVITNIPPTRFASERTTSDSLAFEVTRFTSSQFPFYGYPWILETSGEGLEHAVPQ